MSVTYTDLTYTTFPDQEQNFVEMIDIGTGDATALTSYQNAMMQGNFQAAQAALASMTASDNKIINAIKLNTLFDTCVALERFYKSDVEPYIDQKQEEWEATVALFTNNFAYIGNWNATTQYKRNNMVSLYNSSTGDTEIYIAIADNINKEPYIVGSTVWRKLSFKGLQGLSGEGVTFYGTWNAATQYTQDDVVVYDDQLWQATQASQNQQPGPSSAYWTNYGAFNITTIYVSQTQPTELSEGNFWFQLL